MNYSLSLSLIPRALSRLTLRRSRQTPSSPLSDFKSLLLDIVGNLVLSLRESKMKRGRQDAERTLSSIEPIYVAHSLIEDSLNRCKVSDVVTRITVSLTPLPVDTDDRPTGKSRLSVADTGYGIHPQQVSKYFPYRSCSIGTSTADHDRHLSWDGVLFITTTGIEEQDTRSYSIHGGRAGVTKGKTRALRIFSIESKPKAGSTFSGTEASVLLIGDTVDLEIYIRNLCRKISILNIKGVLIEFCLDDGRQQNSNCDQHEENCELITDGGVDLPNSLSDLDRLGIGIVDYTSRYTYKYREASSDKDRLKQALKVGKGQSVHNALWKMQACFVLLQKDREEIERTVTGTDESIRTFQTQVLCFEDFRYRHSSYALRAIYRVDWSTFGLAIKRVDVRSCAGVPSVVIVWDRPAEEIERFDLVLHRFRDSLPDQKPTWKGEIKMAKSAIEAALQDLKETLPHLLSTRQDVEVQKHIPALARCISGLITSSTNADFRTECADMLGWSPEDEGGMEQFLSSKLLQILVQRTRRGLQSAAGNLMEQEEVHDTAALLAHSQEGQEEEGETASSWIWDFW